MTHHRKHPRAARLLGAGAVVLLGSLLAGPAARVARAQDHEGPSPQEIEQKIREIEKLMKSAEQSLARSTGTVRSRDSAEEAAKKLEELLDKKAQEQTGKSAEQLRKEAAEGSAEAGEALKKLTEEAQSETAKAAAEMERLMQGGSESAREAAEGVRKLLEESQKSGEQSEQGIKWLLENAISKGGGQGGGKEPQKPEKPGGDEKKPDQPKDKKDDPDQPTAKKPQHETEPPRPPDFEVWLAELPAEVRRQYESKNWDAIPVKWRAILRDWTKKMNDELEEGR